MCFSIQVNGKFHTVWDFSHNFAHSVTVSWKPKFNVFATLGKAGSAYTNAVNIALGQQRTLSGNGVWGNITDGPEQHKLNIDNQYGIIRPALKQYFVRSPNGAGFKTCYHAPDAVMKGPVPIQPMSILLVWFSKDKKPYPELPQSGHAKTRATKVDLTRTDKGYLTYQNQSWSHGSS